MKLRVALLVGVNDYQDEPLGNCVADVRKVEAALKRRGFSCTRLENPGAHQIDDALEAFSDRALDAEIALVYLAGHGVERHGGGYFLAADFPFPVSASKLHQYAIAIPRIIESMPSKHTSKFVVADMCRNWPSSQEEDLLRQLDELRKEEGNFENLIVGYSTSAGDTASDGGGTNSWYCDAFCDALLEHSLTFDGVFHRVGDKVISSSSRLQRPWHYSSMRGAGSFSDVDKLSLLNAVSTPLNGRGLPLFVSKLRGGEGIFASGTLPTAWIVSMKGLQSLGPQSSSAVLSVGHLAGERSAFLMEDGNLHLVDEGTGNAIYSRQPFIHPSLMVTSPSSNIVVVCANEQAEIFVVSESQVTSFNLSMSSTIHCGLIVSDDEVWLAGGLGYLLKVQIGRKKASTNEVNLERNNVNFMVRSDRSDEIIVGGSGGKVAFLGHDGSVTRTFEFGDKVRTPRAIREALVDYADADNISKILSEGYAEPDDVRDFLLERIPGTQLLWCDVSPTQPIIAIASAEGLVFVVDVRDGRSVQTIDLWMGAGNTPHGLAFLRDGALAVLLADGLVVFYGQLASATAGLEAAWVASTNTILNLPKRA